MHQTIVFIFHRYTKPLHLMILTVNIGNIEHNFYGSNRTNPHPTYYATKKG